MNARFQLISDISLRVVYQCDTCHIVHLTWYVWCMIVVRQWWLSTRLASGIFRTAALAREGSACHKHLQRHSILAQRRNIPPGFDIKGNFQRFIYWVQYVFHISINCLCYDNVECRINMLVRILVPYHLTVGLICVTFDGFIVDCLLLNLFFVQFNKQ